MADAVTAEYSASPEALFLGSFLINLAVTRDPDHELFSESTLAGHVQWLANRIIEAGWVFYPAGKD